MGWHFYIHGGKHQHISESLILSCGCSACFRRCAGVCKSLLPVKTAPWKFFTKSHWGEAKGSIPSRGSLAVLWGRVCFLRAPTPRALLVFTSAGKVQESGGTVALERPADPHSARMERALSLQLRSIDFIVGFQAFIPATKGLPINGASSVTGGVSSADDI